MMSVGRLIVFDVTVPKSFKYAKIVLALNNLKRQKDRVKYSPRIIVVGDMAKTEEEGTERAIAYD
jgi:predicted ATPase